METSKNQVPQQIEKLREIPKWTQKYARNRTVPVLVSMGIFICLFAGIAIPAHFSGKAGRSGNMLLFGICCGLEAVAMIALLYFSVPKWGGKCIERLSKRLYRSEGEVVLNTPQTVNNKKAMVYIMPLVFVACVFGSVILAGMGYIPNKYMQPVSALYFVPFLVGLYYLLRHLISPLALLWPILYAVHAILIVAGVPILFTGKLEALNMILPTFGYGLLTQLLGLLYSRYALKKLKGITSLEGGLTNEL
ncbi:hypothetical protein ACFL6U_14590 [Planctomycetota bacterium]